MILNEFFGPSSLDVKTSISLNELQGVKAHTDQTFYAKSGVAEYLEDKGFTTLGLGTYGGVFDHPSFKGRYVLKVFSDPFYEHFLNWCATQSGNPHLPKVVGKVMRLTDEARMVRIERLAPMSRAVYGAARLGRYATMMRTPKAVSRPERERVIAFLNEKGLESLRTTLDAVAANMPRGAEIDLTPENFMLRGETIVISDPYAGASIPFLKRPRMLSPEAGENRPPTP